VLGEIARLMEEANVGRVFVCDGEKLAGVISLIDLMAAKLIERARGNELS
jgi:CBS domain-containing protein